MLAVESITAWIGTGLSVFSTFLGIAILLYRIGRKHRDTEAKLDAHNSEMKKLNEETRQEAKDERGQMRDSLKKEIDSARDEFRDGLSEVRTECVDIKGRVEVVKQTTEQSFAAGKERMDRQSSNITQLREETQKTREQVAAIGASMKETG